MTSDHADGTLSARNGRYVLRFERRLAHRVDQVWHALTEPDALRHWFPQQVEGELSVGGKLTFSFPEDKEMPDFHGEVLEYDPPRVLAFTWGEDTLRWELVPDDEGGCRLIFTDTIVKQGKAARDGAGWHVCLDMLVARLDGAVPPPRDLWQRVHAEYVTSFGPEAATMGRPDAG